MDDLYIKIDIVLKECSKSLNDIDKEDMPKIFYSTVFTNFINGPLFQFVKSIQDFLKTIKCKNTYMLYVCLSQIRKCLLLHETTIPGQNNFLNFEKILNKYLIKRIQKCFYKLEDYLEMLDLTDIDEYPGIFIDQMNIVLNKLNNKENVQLVKPHIDKILFQAITIAKVSDKSDNLEITSSSKQVLKAIQQFEKHCINDFDNYFQFDYLSSSLSILERRVNTTILHLIYKIFNDPFCTVKNLIRKCGESINIQHRNSSDLINLISDLDKSTDVLIQIGLFSIACCKTEEYVIPLKCCISSLELLESDMVPAIVEFYLDSSSIVKKMFLKILINHWVSEICKIQNILEKIIDPFAFTLITLEISIQIIDTINKSDFTTNVQMYKKLLNGWTNFVKYIENIFAVEISKENEFSTAYKKFINAFQEYKACLIFNQNITNDPSTKKKLLKRCDLTLKYLKNIQISLCNIMENKSFSVMENTYHILSKTKQSSTYLLQTEDLDDNDELNLILSTVQVQKSFYNKSERKISKINSDQDYSNNINETVFENTITMDLTKILDNFIETFNTNYDNKTAVNIWEEIDVNTPTRMLDLEFVI